MKDIVTMNDLKTELTECYDAVKHITGWYPRINAYTKHLRKRSKYYLNLRNEFGSADPDGWKACIAMADALLYSAEGKPLSDFAMEEYAKMEH